MSFAVYGESFGYVHLVSANTAQDAFEYFLADLKEVGVSLSEVDNIYAVEGTQEAVELEDKIIRLINEAKVEKYKEI